MFWVGGWKAHLITMSCNQDNIFLLTPGSVTEAVWYSDSLLWAQGPDGQIIAWRCK